jgi:hypothetical protein
MENIEISQSLNTYLGSKGYSIFKKDLNSIQIEVIRKELIAKPFIQGAPGMANNNPTFPIYRESINKIYFSSE